MKAWRCLGQYDSETTSYTALAVAGFTSPYAPDFDGRLLGVRAVMNRSAATSLINHVEFKLTCTTFKPNAIEIGCQGNGLQTAPVQQPDGQDWQLDQPVKAGIPITIEGRNVTADTPVTVSIMLYGLFEVGG
jgi:hypothetical protein